MSFTTSAIVNGDSYATASHLLFLYIMQFYVVSQGIQHFYKDFIHNSIAFFDDTVNILPYSAYCLRQAELAFSQPLYI